MEYLTLQDIPHRNHDPLHRRSMASSHSSERPLGNVAAAHERPWRTGSSAHASSPPPLHHIHLPSHVAAKEPSPSPHSSCLHSPYPSRPSPFLDRSEMPIGSVPPATQYKLEPVATTDAPDLNGESSHRAPANAALTDTQTHHMRSSPPIQPGEQTFQPKLPSFSEFLHTTRATTPPRTPSRRNGSADNSPQAKPHFDEIAWTDGKRRRIDTLGDIYSRPTAITEQPPIGRRRLSSAVEIGAANYEATRIPSYDAAQSTLPLHQHRLSLSYPPPVHSSVAQSAPFRQQPSPPAAQGLAGYSQQPRRQSAVSQSSYPPPPVQHGVVYEQRPGYYQEPQAASNGYGYDRPHDSYYSQPVYSGTGYENSYGDIRFHQHVGLDQNAFNRKRRGNLPKEATNVLKEWFALNRASPYPTEDQKIELCTRTGLSLNQVSNWFINARRRAPQKEQREREANNAEA